MALERRVDPFACAKADLHRLVAVALLGLDLDDGAGKRLDDGDGHGAAVRLEHLRHTDFAAEDAFDGHGFSRIAFYSCETAGHGVPWRGDGL
ncbi:MAG: hypothetical protein E6J43_00540 [Chloroflexi bacterium]|nr:MAG: hypothetical protein E6J43_00540 [Chloroflexota bacterium]